MQLTLELFHTGRWHKVAIFEVDEPDVAKGYRAPSALSYLAEYAEQTILEKGIRALSCLYPSTFEHYENKTWPAFLLDILPGGAGREFWLGELNIKDGPAADFVLLQNGAGNAPGNLRVLEAAARLKTSNYIGFTREDVIQKNEDFIRYAKELGAPVAGSSGAQGDAPKWLLVQDSKQGNWHADAAIEDTRVAKHWIVKFPRGKKPSDRAVLKNEAVYMKVAKDFGLRVHGLPHYERDVLFIPRFDRVSQDGTVERYGLETLASIANIAEYGMRPRHEQLLTALVQFVDDPDKEVLEYLMRDVLNLALKNTDNHARNTAILKKDDDSIALSPLYDFAPMFLDDQGIARVCQWEDENGKTPDWGKVLARVGKMVHKPRALKEKFITLAPKVRALPNFLAKAKVDEEIVERLLLGIDEVAQSIEAVKL